MKIHYLQNEGNFRGPCRDAINNDKESLLNGENKISFEFDESRGYRGDIQVTIKEDDNEFFETDWEGQDCSRFPARIKACATALRDVKCLGSFKISHNNGHLEISLVNS